MNARKMAGIAVAAALSSLSLTGVALAIPLNGQYSVSTTVTQLDTNKYRFEYSITNNTDTLGADTGLDILELAIPMDATITNIYVPYSSGPGHWEGGISTTPGADLSPGWFDSNASSTGQYLWFAGLGVDAVYEIGSTAAFSFVADNVRPGLGDAVIVTFWGYKIPSVAYRVHPTQSTNLTGYLTQLQVPVAIPEPATLTLLALSGLAVLRRKRRSR